jgi:hypothetical protein
MTGFDGIRGPQKYARCPLGAQLGLGHVLAARLRLPEGDPRRSLDGAEVVAGVATGSGAGQRIGRPHHPRGRHEGDVPKRAHHTDPDGGGLNEAPSALDPSPLGLPLAM